jgi:hypothetical protein
MSFQTRMLCAVAVSGLSAFLMTVPAQALSMQECGAKYQNAKTAGTLNGQDWKTFRKTQCAAAEATPAAAPAAAPAAPAAPPPATTAAAKPKKEAAPAPAPVATGNAVFPSAVDPKYSSLTAGKQRFKTCDDQYNANKATNGNGGLKWIQKGGGYYSECNKRLKGPA